MIGVRVSLSLLSLVAIGAVAQTPAISFVGSAASYIPQRVDVFHQALPNSGGMFTVNQRGSGDAVVYHADGTLVTPTNAAHAGEVLVFWATGVGPVAFDETMPAPGGDLTNVPLEVYIGGKPATVLYRGRNPCCSSVDQINVQLPTGISGCLTPVMMKVYDIVGNTTSIPISASGSVCTLTSPFISQSELSTLFGKATLSTGFVTLTRSITTAVPVPAGLLPGQSKQDSSSAVFARIAMPVGAGGLGTLLDIPAFGACVTYSGSRTAPGFGGLSHASLDAGPAITISGPGGDRFLRPQTATDGSISYDVILDPGGNYLNAGQYTIGSQGGHDVGSFTSPLTIPQPLVWRNQLSTTFVNRANGVTVTWSGGDPAGFVQISGYSVAGIPPIDGPGASFICTAKTSDGSFTVPSMVLLALPRSGSLLFDGTGGGLSVASVSGISFQATGLDLGLVTGTVINTNRLTYQ